MLRQARAAAIPPAAINAWMGPNEAHEPIVCKFHLEKLLPKNNGLHSERGRAVNEPARERLATCIAKIRRAFGVTGGPLPLYTDWQSQHYRIGTLNDGAYTIRITKEWKDGRTRVVSYEQCPPVGDWTSSIYYRSAKHPRGNMQHFAPTDRQLRRLANLLESLDWRAPK